VDLKRCPLEIICYTALHPSLRATDGGELQVLAYAAICERLFLNNVSKRVHHDLAATVLSATRLNCNMRSSLTNMARSL
jgi:hypothetical protein